MPFVLIIIGLVMIVTAWRNTHADLGAQLVKDFTGASSFVPWMLAICFVGAIGYSDTARPFSRAFLALIIIALLLTKKNVLTQFVTGATSGGTAPAPVAGTTQASSSNSQSGSALGSVIGGQAGSSLIGTIGSLL